VTYARGKVYDKKTDKPLRAKFELIDLETQERVVESYSDPENGEFLVVVPTEKNYMLNASAEGYLFFSENFELSGEKGKDVDNYAFDVPMKPIEKGETVVLKIIFFETDKYKLKPESKAELTKLVEFLNNNPTLKIEIGGHTDNVGSKDYNQQLSENRAKSVYTYLIDAGIKAERLSFKGYNFSEPIASNDTEEGRAQNRRTEFKIIEK
jgi:outer membrane protein OmpA-like peptidoglycan-associated protein